MKYITAKVAMSDSGTTTLGISVGFISRMKIKMMAMTSRRVRIMVNWTSKMESSMNSDRS